MLQGACDLTYEESLEKGAIANERMADAAVAQKDAHTENMIRQSVAMERMATAIERVAKAAEDIAGATVVE